MIDVETARRLLDFAARLPNDKGGRAEQQLEGAVALHNILKKHGVAYLADEVGLGKTYVALGVVALLRHFDPALRVLVIAPRENIQRKWMKETRNFIRHNVRHADLRVRELDGSPSRPLVMCENLADLVREASLDPRRDFFARMTSFSVGLAGDAREASREAKENLREQVREAILWVSDAALDLRLGKAGFKEAVARAICCALPEFDLVIVDEGHNLKHGFTEQGSTRNRVMGLVFGHPGGAPPKELEPLFPGYGPRARYVLFLSATPVEESYRHLWNQLDVFGKGDLFPLLSDPDAGEGAKREEARRFLIRRVTEIEAGGERHTKNLYRRDWRFGGVDRHDDPIRVDDPRGRLVVALVQKKVMEILGSEKFGSSFQIGMLASFESFLETSRLKEKAQAEEEQGEPQVKVFDDADQTEDPLEREGLDVHALNGLARDYRKQFGAELPHPKMDALVKTLADRWTSGRKALVFVRRIGSVKELKAKLDAEYDTWLKDRLMRRLSGEARATLERWWERYREERTRGRSEPDATDTFFSWFFRGDPKRGVFSGALLQRSFTRPGSVNATFFEVNDVGRMLGAAPGQVLARLAEEVGLSPEEAREQVNALGKGWLRGKAQRLYQFEAAQVGGLHLLALRAGGALADEARLLLAEKFPAPRSKGKVRDGASFAGRLEERTLFSELIRNDALRADLWPEPDVRLDPRERVREREQRALLLATAARLGHSLIDLYILAVNRRGSLNPGRAEEEAEERGDLEGQENEGAVELAAESEADDDSLVDDFIRLLEGQRTLPPGFGWFGAYDELSAIGRNFPLIVDVNLPDVAELPLAATGARFGTLLGEQQPVAGMSGQVNMTLVRQFRMPGYPFVLVSTDLLQEGEDLHTFCSDVFHYGISWTPSSMEQRIGRVDRVRSLTERRLKEADRKPEGTDKLQVYYPYLSETVEVLQVVRVLKRMDTFLRLMHEDLALPELDQRRLSVAHEIMGAPAPPAPIPTLLQSAFPVRKDLHLAGKGKRLVVDAETEKAVLGRLERLCSGDLGGLPVEWQVSSPRGQRTGNATLPDGRRQPFIVEIQGRADDLLLRCFSHVGQIGTRAQQQMLLGAIAEGGGRVHVLKVGKKGDWLVSVAEDVLLADERHDAERLAWLVRRVVTRADELEQQLLGDVDAGLDEMLKARKEHGRARHEGDSHA